MSKAHVLIALLAIVTTGCGDKGGNAACESGWTRLCECPGGEPGTETCDSTGTWGECDCATADTSTDSTPDTTVEDTLTEDTDQPEVGCTLDGECDDANDCTDDACNLDFGLCEWTAVDDDGDGFPAAEVGGTDCGGTDCDDDADATYPDAPVSCEDLDRDCSGMPDNDEDGDGYLDADLCPGTGDDCDDSDASINPGETPSCEDIDRDCDGAVDCTDPACVWVADCSCAAFPGGTCDDANPCTFDSCESGICVFAGEADGSPCDSGGPAGVCCAATCEPRTTAEGTGCCGTMWCDDGNSCTTNTCTDHTCETVLHDDGTACTDVSGSGICCSSTCEVDGECCVDADCGTPCRGTPVACDAITAAGPCGNQDGCTWYDVPTVGGCANDPACGTFTTQIECAACDICNWHAMSGSCIGSVVAPCETILSGTDCLYCGCVWYVLDACDGVAEPCGPLSTVTTCQGQDGCEWFTCDSSNLCTAS